MNLILSSGSNQITARALVDTGSPFCIFGRAIADALDLDMQPSAGKDRKIRILGDHHTARAQLVTLQLPPFDGLHWETECYFLHADLDTSWAGVLGQEGFLDRWVASFNLYDGYFVIEERDTFVHRMPIDPTKQFTGIFDSEWDRPTKF